MNLESPFGGASPNLGDSGSGGLVAPFDIGKVVGSGPITDYSSPAGSVTGAASAPSMDVVGKAWSKLLSWLGVPSISDVVGMVLGLLLVAAGIFLFKPVHEVATGAAKTAVKAAVVAA